MAGKPTNDVRKVLKLSQGLGQKNAQTGLSNRHFLASGFLTFYHAGSSGFSAVKDLDRLI